MGLIEAAIDIFANLNFALVDLFFLEVLMMTVFHVDKGGHIKLTFDWIHGLSKSWKTEVFIGIFILLGLAYFFITNLYQKSILNWFFTFFGLWNILLTFVLMLFEIFFISKFNLERNWNFRLCLPVLIVDVILFLILAVGLAIRYS